VARVGGAGRENVVEVKGRMSWTPQLNTVLRIRTCRRDYPIGGILQKPYGFGEATVVCTWMCASGEGARRSRILRTMWRRCSVNVTSSDTNQL
jgi:hypothetical protein